MFILLVSALCAGLFAGAAIYINVVEHPARLSWSEPSVILGAVLLGAVVPFTLIVILPTNKRLLDPALDPRGPEATELLVRWGRLHAIRSILSSIAFVLLLLRLGVA